MLNKKFLVTFFVTLIYIALFFLYSYYSKRAYGCGFGTPCLRFCSSDTYEYSDDKLLEAFGESKTAQKMARRVERFKVIRGAPFCGSLKFWPPKNELNSTNPPYEFDYYGEAEVDENDYGVSRYCLEKADDVYDGWKLMICYQDYYLQKGFHIFSIFLSIFLFGFTLFIYAYFQELRDFHGKTIIAIMGSQIAIYVQFPFSRHFSETRGGFEFMQIMYALFAISIIVTFLWITVLNVHTYLTFRNFKTQTSIPYEFSTYAIFVVSFSIFSAFEFIINIINHSYRGFEFLLFMCFLIGFVDVVLLIITGVKIFTTSRHLEHSEQARFDTEKKWYWIIIKMSLAMIITLFLETITWGRDFNMLTQTFVDLVNLLTATSILLMLVRREKARILLFGKYREVDDVAVLAD